MPCPSPDLCLFVFCYGEPWGIPCWVDVRFARVGVGGDHHINPSCLFHTLPHLCHIPTIFGLLPTTLHRNSPMGGALSLCSHYSVLRVVLNRLHCVNVSPKPGLLLCEASGEGGGENMGVCGR